MKRLNVSDNQINDEGARHLSTCMTRMEKLCLRNCDITEENLKMLSSAIKNLREPVMLFILVLLHALYGCAFVQYIFHINAYYLK